MDGTLVFAKTPTGIVEISTRSAQLASAARRVLIMIDGKRSVDELAMVLPPGAIDTVIGQLEAAGLIRRPLECSARCADHRGGREDLISTSSVGAGSDDPNPMTLEEAKRRAVRELTDRLGPDADTLSMRIERCHTIEDFRECVREAERFVAAMLGPAAAQDYLRALRRRN